MEWEAKLNFKFKQPVEIDGFVQAFKEFAESTDTESRLRAFSFTNDKAKERLEELLKDEAFVDLFSHSYLNKTKTKLSIEFMTGHEEEIFIHQFFGLVLLMGGRPLKSLSLGDGFMQYIYTYSDKNGLQLTVKEEPYNDDED